MLKKNVSLILVVLLALLLIALVIWLYEKRMEDINDRMHNTSAMETNYRTRK